MKQSLDFYPQPSDRIIDPTVYPDIQDPDYEGLKNYNAKYRNMKTDQIIARLNTFIKDGSISQSHPYDIYAIQKQLDIRAINYSAIADPAGGFYINQPVGLQDKRIVHV